MLLNQGEMNGTEHLENIAGSILKIPQLHNLKVCATFVG